MYDLNVTMIAFHEKRKTAPLQELLADTLGAISANLPPSAAWAFSAYEFNQIHATVLGMEADVLAGRVISRWWKKNRGQERGLDIDRLRDTVNGFVVNNRLFTIRFGGFPEAHCNCRQERPEALDRWDCLSSAAEFHSCDRSTYDGSFYAFSPGPVVLTGWPVGSPGQVQEFTHQLFEFRKSTEDAGLLDKYHGNEKPHWKDDDCFIRIGTFTGAISVAQLTATHKAVRDFLSGRQPVTVDVNVEDVEIVLYERPSMEEGHIRKKVPLAAFLNDPSVVNVLYDEILKEATG